MSDIKLNDSYYLLLQGLADGIIITDPEGYITFVNHSAEQIRNIKAEDMIGQHILKCHKDSSREKVMRAMNFLTAHRDKSYHRMVIDHENHKVYENTYTAIFNDQDILTGIAVITKDRTEERKAEESAANFQRSQTMALENLKTQFYNLHLDSMEMLSNIIESKDKYADGHSKRVADISSKMYELRNGITQDYLDIQWAAKLHDIGKICIPDQIISKPGKLSEEEYTVVKKHCIIADAMVRKLDYGNRVAPSIRHHHERFDGKGYPDGLSKTDIPTGSRIIAIADTYDAMHSCRPYRNSIPFENCLEEIQKNAGTQFDPEWVDVFTELAENGSIE